MKAIACLLVLFCLSAYSQIVPAGRLASWQGNVGIPGGITNRTTQWCDVKASIPGTALKAAGNGSTDDTAALQYALDHCPAGQVIYIPAGTYKVTAQLTLKDSYTVRGAGRTSTIISGQGGNCIIAFGTRTSSNAGYYDGTGSSGTGPAVTGGTAVRGATSITLASTTGCVVGGYLQINELDNSTYVSEWGNDSAAHSDCTWCAGPAAGRNARQIVEITGINGSTVSIAPPGFFWNFTNSPQSSAFTMGLKYAGIESLQLYANNIGMEQNIRMFACAYCWVKDVESNYADGDHVLAGSCYRCEIRDSYFHDGFNHSSGQTDDSVRIVSGSTYCLVENNILRRLHVPLMLEWGGGGHVIGYNYLTNSFSSDGPNGVPTDLNYHGAHTAYCLFEGNLATAFCQDGTWGTASHGTLLRNVITGKGYVCPPYTGGRAAEQTGSYIKQYASARAINLAGYGNSKCFNVVGNILGSADMGNYPQFSPIYMLIWPANRQWDHEGNVFSLGYANGSDDGSFNGDNTDPYTTLINHGNWDAVHNSIQWSNNIPDRVIPQSYYLASKPSFFGILTWPAFNPTNSPVTTNLPAGYRYWTGSFPPTGTNQPPLPPTLSLGQSQLGKSAL